MKWFITACLFLPLLCRIESTEDIMTEGKVGDDIVKRVLDVLKPYNIPLDRKCFQELAVLRSNNGVPYIAGEGGIWRVNISQLTDAQTACQISLLNQCSISKILTGEEFSSFDIADLDKPLYSALAMIFYALSLNNSIPLQDKDYVEYCKLCIKSNGTSTEPLKSSNQEFKNKIASISKKSCTIENADAGRFYFAHPDPTKYIQCTEYGTYYEMPCASGTIWSQTAYTCVIDNGNPVDGPNTETITETKTTTICTILKNNPCTKENIHDGKFYFSHPDPTKFIQCTVWGTYYEMPCAPGTTWSQTVYTCIRNSRNKMTEDTTQIPTETKTTTPCTILKNNPCTKENIHIGKFYFSHPDPTKFIQCTVWGIYYEMPCAPGTIWSQTAYTCIRNSGIKMTDDTTQIPTETKTTNPCTILKHNPCTKENIDAGKFYFAHPDPTKFIQCTAWGTYYEMPCAPGTIWSQTAYTCIRNSGNKMTKDTTQIPTETKSTISRTILKHNPCTKENIDAGKFYFAHPDPTKFIQCTVWGTYYEMPCAPGTTWSQTVYTCIRNSRNKMTEDTTQIPTETKTTTPCTILKNNPCTKENIHIGKFYFSHPDPTKFIQCTTWGTYYEMPCAPGTIWSQTAYTCIRNSGNKMTEDTTQIPTETKTTNPCTILKHNPCTKENIDAGKFYFAHPDPTKFIQCTAWGTYYEMPCAPGTIWSQTAYTCIRNSGNKMTKDTTQIPTETKSTISRTILKHNPCTKENIDAGKFYFAHSDPTKFIQCTVWGTYYEMPCAPGTTWSQTVYTCIRNSRNKMNEDTTQIPTETKTTTPCTILKNNPCTKENIHIGKFYFSHPDLTKLIQCTAWGTYYEMPCAPSTIWSQTAYTCIRNSGNKMTEDTTQIPTETKTTTPCTILKHNPCTKENIDAGKFYFAHPDPTKFIQCTAWGTYYEMPCAPGTIWSQTAYTCIRNSGNKMTEDTIQIPIETKTTTPCNILKHNPCTKENIDAGKFYFSHPDPTKFIQCTTWGTYYEMPCAPSTIWSQTAYTCIRNSGNKMTEDTTQIPTERIQTTLFTLLNDNPCTKENIDAGKFYFSHPDPTKFIQCTARGTYYEMPCAPGTIWSQTAYTCIRNSGNKMTEDTTQIPTETKTTISRTILKHNPCTKENIDAGKFYFVHPDPTKFIQCTAWGTYYEMPCAPGTIWSQIAYTCVHTFVECNSRQVTIEPSKTSLPFPSTFKWVTRGGLS